MSDHDQGAGKPRGICGFFSKLFWGSRDETVGPPAVTPSELSPLRPAGDEGSYVYRDDATLDAQTLGEVLEQLEAGRKIEAIKLYREATGVGLKDGKEAVERLANKRAA